MKIKATHYAYGSYRFINNVFLYYDGMENEISKFSREIIEPGVAYKYQGDFYGLLSHLNVQSHLLLPSLYLNGLASPYDYDGRTTEILIAGEINFPKQ